LELFPEWNQIQGDYKSKVLIFTEINSIYNSYGFALYLKIFINEKWGKEEIVNAENNLNTISI
jgi:hypothetical protein